MSRTLANDLLLDNSVFGPPAAATMTANHGRGPLHAGSVWEGLQRSGRNSYKVRVKIDTVNLEQGTVSGLLEIQHLTPELDSLVTSFEGEIIGDKAGFKTNRWGATEADDMKHWSRFPAFTKGLRSTLTKPNLNFKHHINKPYLFMRWKEQFVFPSTTARIHGASFAGFYYLCLDLDACGPPEPVYPPLPLSEASRRHQTSMSPPVRSGMSRSLPPRRMSSDATRRASTSVAQVSRSSASANSTVLESAPILPRGRSYSSAVSTSPANDELAPPPRPRRASSATFSYAAAVRGAPPSLERDPPSGTQLPPPPAAASLSANSSHAYGAGALTPKEIDNLDFTALSQGRELSTTGPTPSSSTASATNTTTAPIDIPTRGGSAASANLTATPGGQSRAAVLDRDRIGVSPTSLDEQHEHEHERGQAMSAPEADSYLHDRGRSGSPLSGSSSAFAWSGVNEAGRHGNAAAATRSSLDAILLRSAATGPIPDDRSNTISFALPSGTSPSTVHSILQAPPPAASRSARRLGVQGESFPHLHHAASTAASSSPSSSSSIAAASTYGHASYTSAKMTGFYFFRHSEPYQELSLRYVPGAVVSSGMGMTLGLADEGVRGERSEVMREGGRRGGGEAFEFR